MHTKEVDKNMWNEIYLHAYNVLSLMFNKALILISLVFGLFLSSIGYPKEILIFILTLIIIDLVTKQGLIVVINYGKFTLKNYKNAWVDRHLTSRAIKNGISVKVILYSPILYFAHQLGVIPEILYGSVISSVLYTLIILTEISSIFENGIASGKKGLIPFLNFINRRKEELIENSAEELSKEINNDINNKQK